MSDRRRWANFQEWRDGMGRKDVRCFVRESTRVSIVIPTYNAENDIVALLESIAECTQIDHEIIIVDDASTDSTPEVVRTQCPECKLIVLETNSGHSAACNTGMREAGNRIVVLIDCDAVVTEGWLPPLVDTLQSCEGAVMCESVIADVRAGRRRYNVGGSLHFCGSACLDMRDTLEEVPADLIEVGYIGTTCMAIDTEKLRTEGSEVLDEEFFIYQNDIEFSARERLMGGTLWCVPSSVATHGGGRSGLSAAKGRRYPWRSAYYKTRNRWLLMLKLYRVRTLIVLMPMLTVMECAAGAYFLTQGALWGWVRGLLGIVPRLPDAMRKRREIQGRRMMRDRDLLSAAPLYVVNIEDETGALARLKSLLDGVVQAYWHVAKHLIG